MKDKPTGNVTFLFTDIEGSTLLAQEFPEFLPAALEIHHTIIRKATESNNGFVYEIVGDAFCCAFHNSVDAINAAIAAQINLVNEKWDEVKIKIRIGIHSGNVEWNGKRYMGYITLARTARVMSAAYGQQIIISNDAYELAKEKIPDKISFRDLGERRLKDLKQPVRLFQILSEGLRENFPPLKTLDARPNNLPVQLTSFIGREAEMKTIKDLLKKTHVLTLTGSGGAGKTRLALQIAADVIDDYANGVWFVELASLSETAFLPQSIMKVFELKEEPKRNLEDTLCEFLNEKEMLIILDNCEHLVEASAKLTEKLLNNSSKLKIIATSREGLRCEGEHTHRVLSLEVPDPKEENSPEQLSQYEAVRLFIERALAVDDTFRINNNNAPALAGICYQLDGIPLAIELAAVKTKVLTVEQIYKRLNDRFKLLTGGKRTALPRQQTLRALIDWSYDLLSEKEQILWRRLSVFAGGWTLEAAEEVCSDEKIKQEEVLDFLNQLIEKSIIYFEKEKERYRILETLKQYVGEKLKVVNESEEILSMHLNYFMGFSELAEPKLSDSGAQVWTERLESEHSNLLFAIEWSLKNGDMEKGARLAGALRTFWQRRGYCSIGSQLTKCILDNINGVSKSVHGKLLLCAGNLAEFSGEYEKAEKFYDESLTISRQFNLNLITLSCLNSMGILAIDRGNYDNSQKFFEEVLKLSRELRHKSATSSALFNLGNIAYNLGNYDQAQKLYEESLTLRYQLSDKSLISFSLNALGNVATIQGKHETAKKYHEESLALAREVGDKYGIAYSLSILGSNDHIIGNYDQAQKYHEESLALRNEIGYKGGIAMSLNNLGHLAYDQGNFEKAQKYCEMSLAIRFEIDDKNGIAMSLNLLGVLALTNCKFKQAQKFCEESLAIRRELGEKPGIAESLWSLGKLAFDQRNYQLARKFYEETLTLKLEMGDKLGITESLIGFVGIISADNHLSHAVKLLGAANMALQSMRLVLQRSEQKLQEKFFNELHEKLTNEEYSKFFEEGKKLSLEQAAELALSHVK